MFCKYYNKLLCSYSVYNKYYPKNDQIKNKNIEIELKSKKIEFEYFI